MVKWSNNIAYAIKECLEHEVPFAFYSKPEEPDITFFSNPGFKGKRPDTDSFKKCFFIGEWLQKSADFIAIEDELDVDQTLEFLGNKERRHNENLCSHECFRTKEITKEEYLASVESLIGEIKAEGLGKVVLSRSKSLPGINAGNVPKVAMDIFDAFPHSFRYIFYTPSTGAWLGATPELLLFSSKDSRCVHTMALAGTRKLTGHDVDWDAKDIEEQAIVARFIVDELRSLGLTVTESDMKTLTTGDLQHIMTQISGYKDEKGGKIDVFEVIDVLNPTPALCGYPRVKAEELIDKYEAHDRRCYGGIVGVMTDKECSAFVNLRCAKFNPEVIRLFAGGGILPQSDPHLEWEETENKFSALTRFLLADK